MNVGSILNEETPPSDNEAKVSPQPIPHHESSQRNSIVNLLNEDKTDPIPEPIPEPSRPEPIPELAKEDIKDEETIPKPSINNFNNSNGPISEKQPAAEPLNPSSTINTTSTTTTTEPPTQNNHSATNDSIDKEDDDISKLNKLKQNSKPKRYATPPIWAQEWVPANKRNSSEIASNDGLGIGLGGGGRDFHEPSISDKSIFNTNSTTSVDLECSITGVIPPPSVTRRIAEWIYANFVEVTEENRKHIELELKFGTIMDKKLDNRINILVSTECIFTDVSSIYFESGIHQVGFTDVLKYFEELERNYQEDLKNQPNHSNKPRRKFNTLESDITDLMYFVTNRNEQPKQIRISKDNALNPPRYTAINKQRISDLYIHNPSSMYDLRLSLSLENPVPNEEIDPIMKKSKPINTRIKRRSTFGHKPTVTTFDLTRVSTPRELKNTTTGKKVTETENTFEVELEIDVPELFNGFDQFKNGINSIRFEELVEIFVNNARCVNNRITKLAK